MPQNRYLRRQTLTLAELASYQPCNLDELVCELRKLIGDHEEFCITSQLVERLGRARVVGVRWFASNFLTDEAHQELLLEISHNFYEGYHRYVDIEGLFLAVFDDLPRNREEYDQRIVYHMSFFEGRQRMHDECRLRALVTILREGEREVENEEFSA